MVLYLIEIYSALNYYEILEVHQSASYAEIKKSYRRLVKIYHPDVNPSALARDKILKITEAYEVLSDPNARASYDWQISLSGTPDIDFTYKQEPQVDEREVQRREYVKWKRKREQERWQQQFHMKAVFYKYQRYFAFLFLLVGILFTYDHFVSSDEVPVQVQKVILDKWGNSRVTINGIKLQTNAQMYYDFKNSLDHRGVIRYSGVFGKPAKIGLAEQGIYAIDGTLYQFGNFFAFMVILICAGLIHQKKYSDFMMTLGLLPIFLVWFLLVFIIVS